MKNVELWIHKAIQELGDITQEAVDEYLRQRDDKAYQEGRDAQYKKDIKAVVATLLELNISDQKILQFLSERFYMDSISEASEYIRSGKITRQIKALREYCQSNGMSAMEFREYADSYNIKALLNNNERLLDVKPEKLKVIVEKQSREDHP